MLNSLQEALVKAGLVKRKALEKLVKERKKLSKLRREGGKIEPKKEHNREQESTEEGCDDQVFR